MKPIDKNIFKGLLPPHPIILDVGCYDGKDGLELHEMFGGQLHAFDPLDMFEGHGLPAVYFYMTALGKINGITVLHTSPQHPQSSSLMVPTGHLEVWPDVDFNNKIEVPCSKLDDIWNWNSADKRIDLVWADLNGSEAAFIEGAQKTLEYTRYLYIEVCNKELYEGQVLKEGIIKMLPGWSLKAEYNMGENFGNLLFRNRNYGKSI